MIEYVAGFLFAPDRTSVALVLKDHPAWQEGHLNGIGGKKEAGETWAEAMSREFEEEAGVRIHAEDWEHTVTLTSPNRWELRFYRAFSDLVHTVKSMESETNVVVPVVRLGHLGYLHGKGTIPNLGWAIPMSLDDHLDFPVVLREKVAQG